MVCTKPCPDSDSPVRTRPLKENFNPLSSSAKFRFTGKTDFLSQIKKVDQFKDLSKLTYLNGQLVLRSDMANIKDSSNHLTNEELKSYNATPCKG